MPFCTSQDLEALHEELTRSLAPTAINCPVFAGMQKSNDNCVVDVCFCVKLDVAFIPDTPCSSPQGCPGSAALPVRGSTLLGQPSFFTSVSTTLSTAFTRLPSRHF